MITYLLDGKVGNSSVSIGFLKKKNSKNTKTKTLKIIDENSRIQSLYSYINF